MNGKTLWKEETWRVTRQHEIYFIPIDSIHANSCTITSIIVALEEDSEREGSPSPNYHSPVSMGEMTCNTFPSQARLVV